jgi:hypothetical protein
MYQDSRERERERERERRIEFQEFPQIASLYDVMLEQHIFGNRENIGFHNV